MSKPDPGPVLDLLPDGVVVADGAGVVHQVNEIAARLLGSTARPGTSLEHAMALQDREGNSWYDENLPYAGMANRTGIPEQSWFLPDGTEVLVTTRLHRPARGAPVDRVAVVLRGARARERLDRERSDLVATVAHELRSPLTGVKGFVTTLLNRWDRLNDEQKKLMLTTVRSDSERLSRLITELLDVARIDTGRLSFYPREVAPGPVLHRVAESVGVGSTRSVRVHEDGDLPEVFADPDKLIQVLTNLVDNAVRHGEGDVTLRARKAADPFPSVRITVDDEGEGIPDEIRSRVFTKFWQYGVRGGSGLGMYIVNGLVTAHGGQVSIGEAPGGGARVEVLWPLGDRRRQTRSPG